MILRVRSLAALRCFLSLLVRRESASGAFFFCPRDWTFSQLMYYTWLHAAFALGSLARVAVTGNFDSVMSIRTSTWKECSARDSPRVNLLHLEFQGCLCLNYSEQTARGTAQLVEPDIALDHSWKKLRLTRSLLFLFFPVKPNASDALMNQRSFPDQIPDEANSDSSSSSNEEMLSKSYLNLQSKGCELFEEHAALHRPSANKVLLYYACPPCSSNAHQSNPISLKTACRVCWRCGSWWFAFCVQTRGAQWVVLKHPLVKDLLDLHSDKINSH